MSEWLRVVWLWRSCSDAYSGADPSKHAAGAQAVTPCNLLPGCVGRADAGATGDKAHPAEPSYR